MPCLAASCAAVSSPRSASRATFALKSAEYRVRLPVIRVCPSHRQTELNRLSEIRGPPQSAPGRAWLGLPCLDGFVGEPDRQAPALAEAGVVLAPVRHLALLPGNMVAAVLVQLEGHTGHPRAGEGSSCYSGSTCSVTNRIRATTPRLVLVLW